MRTQPNRLPRREHFFYDPCACYINLSHQASASVGGQCQDLQIFCWEMETTYRGIGTLLSIGIPTHSGVGSRDSLA